MNNSPLPLGVIAAINDVVNANPSADAPEEGGIGPGEVNTIGGMSNGKEVHKNLQTSYETQEEDLGGWQGPRNRKERRAQASQSRSMLKALRKKVVGPRTR